MRTFTLLAVPASLLMLTGCASLSGQTAAQAIEKTRVDLASQEFGSLYAAEYAQFVQIYSITNSTPDVTVTVVNGVPSTTYTYAPPVKPPPVNDLSALKTYVNAGFAYVDRRCGEYFDLLHSFYRRKRESVTNVNLFTGLLSGIAAATKAKANEIAVLAVGGTSTAAMVENDGSSMLFSIDPSSTRGLTIRALNGFRDTSRTQPAESFPEAVRQVRGYAALCTPVEIERLVNEAVQNGIPKAVTPEPVVPELGILSTALGIPGPLSTDQVAALYWLLRLDGGTTDGDQIKKIRSWLGDNATYVLQQGQSALLDGTQDKLRISRAKAALDYLAAIDDKIRSRALELKSSAPPSQPAGGTPNGGPAVVPNPPVPSTSSSQKSFQMRVR